MKPTFWIQASLKWGKIATTGGTMLLSLCIYAMIWGWPYATGVVALLFIHEMGHYIAARRRGLDAGAPTFIPFLGAWVQLKDHPVDVRTEAYIAIAGPLAGTAGAVAFYLWGRWTDNTLLLAISYAGLFLNLFNLLPLSPLDGGRIAAILSPRVWLLGVPLLAALAFCCPLSMLLIVAVLSIPQLIAAWNYDPLAPENAAYYDVPLRAKLEYGALYIALAAYLGVMTYQVRQMLNGMASPVSG